MNIILEIKNCKFLGSGAEGSVYLTEEGYAIKLFKDVNAAKREEEILNITKDSVFFPNTILRIDNILIREYVAGENLYEYLKKHGLSYSLSIEIIELIEDLKRLNFKKLNARNSHIFVDSSEKIMVIDPRKSFTTSTPYPKDIIKILLKLHLFDKFLKDVLRYKPNLLSYWIEGYNYLASIKNHKNRRHRRHG
ncbi:serine/threonine protein kinase [Clostridium peptidivorans]|uniref:serine/threonine protein kinase n=1 Tax=Clostridium peptidivorans TaxID=100174 RepID=UPI000BE230A0|nr:serine/threonine protein kinase [Clostridium peptidivorans]